MWHLKAPDNVLVWLAMSSLTRCESIGTDADKYFFAARVLDGMATRFVPFFYLDSNALIILHTPVNKLCSIALGIAHCLLFEQERRVMFTTLQVHENGAGQRNESVSHASSFLHDQSIVFPRHVKVANLGAGFDL